MVLGESGASGSAKKGRAHTSAPTVDFDLAQTWRDVPKPAKFGVPTAFVVLAGWMFLPSMSSGVAYQDQAEVVGRALVSGNRAKVVAMATPATAEAAGKWYDLVYPPFAAKGEGAVGNDAVRASLYNGNPGSDSSLSLGVSVISDKVAANFMLDMVKVGGQWKLDGDKCLSEAERASAPVKLAKKR